MTINPYSFLQTKNQKTQDFTPGLFFEESNHNHNPIKIIFPKLKLMSRSNSQERRKERRKLMS